MVRLYQEGLIMREVGERLGTCKTSVRKALKIYGVKARPQWKITINYDLTPEKAYILSVLGPGDGSMVIFHQSLPWIALRVTDKDFANEFARCFQTAYGVEPTTYISVSKGSNRKPRYAVENHRWPIFRDILSYNDGDLKTFRHGGEKVPDAVKEAPPEVKAMYLRGFFDSQGWVTRDIASEKKNGEVLKEIQSLLLDFGIESSIYKVSLAFRLRILSKGGKLFYEKIGFSIKRKQERLEKLVGGD